MSAASVLTRALGRGEPPATATVTTSGEGGLTRGAPALSVQGLSVRFGGVQAVDGVSFDVTAGSILGLVGPNGAGKTTVFDAIGGFVPATGDVALAGRQVGGSSPEVRARAGLGRSFQDAKLFPSLTVAEVLACAFERHIRAGAGGLVSTALSLPWVRRSEHRIRDRVDGLIDLMGLGAFRDKFVAELSTGSRRIVDLAVILAHDPSVLLLDEPSSGIAQKETEALGPLLLRIRADTGTAMLVIEHDMPLIRSVSDRILALETGQVLTIGEPDVVLEDPRLVAAYLGTDQAVVQRSGARRVRASADRVVASTPGAAVEVGVGGPEGRRPLRAEPRRRPRPPVGTAAPAGATASRATPRGRQSSPSTDAEVGPAGPPRRARRVADGAGPTEGARPPAVDTGSPGRARRARVPASTDRADPARSTRPPAADTAPTGRPRPVRARPPRPGPPVT